MAAYHVWHENDAFWYDDAEDHGGFDRCVPRGPFASHQDAMREAEQVFSASAECVMGEKPAHYYERSLVSEDRGNPYA